MLDRKDYKDYTDRFNDAFNYMKKYSKPQSTVIQEICTLRGYSYERMGTILKEADFIYLSKDCGIDTVKLYNYSKNNDLALFKNNKFLLTDRYIFPVRDMLGNILALIGWYPDVKKYITTPSRFFKKDKLFYGLEQLGIVGIGKPTILVEGIFDSLSLRSIGYNSYAMMGIDSSQYKIAMYGLFGRVLAIPDCDKMGISVLKTNKWNIPISGGYLKWSTELGIKDIDILVNSFEIDGVTDLINKAFHSKDFIFVY